METITIALVISIIGIVLNVFNFYYARKKDTINREINKIKKKIMKVI